MEVTLIVIRGKVGRDEIAFHPPAVMGRSREADLTVAHPMISRQHCELYEVNGLLMVRDLGSLNGTVVGDRKVVESALCPDDRFSVGPFTFQVQYQYAGDRDAVPRPKLAEPDKGEWPTEAAAGGERAPDGPPVFSEIAPTPAGPPVEEAGPWANPMPAGDDGPWANVMPADDGEDAVESDADAEVPGFLRSIDVGSSEKASPDAEVADTVDEHAVDAEARALPEEKPRAAPPGKEKRGWKLWPFGDKKGGKAEANEAAPAAEKPAEAVAEPEPVQVEVPAEPPAELSGNRDTPQDEVVADFLAGAEAAIEEPEVAAEPEEPERQPDSEDDAFEDFLKGLP